MNQEESYLEYIAGVRRYSPRTVEVYRRVLDNFRRFCDSDDIAPFLNRDMLRSYEASLVQGRELSPATVNLYLSVLSGFARFLSSKGELASNPVHGLSRPKKDKRLPLFYREEAMEEYFNRTLIYSIPEIVETIRAVPGDKEDKSIYGSILSRLIIEILYSTGIRRAELISLRVSDADLSRRTLSVLGKGNKMRSVPMTDTLCMDISLYLQVRGKLGMEGERLLLTPAGKDLYPVFVDRVVKTELSKVSQISVRKSPHVLRHTLATELLDDGAPIGSIKELLGHSSLAATQVYTHNSVEKLKKAYMGAHPRAKDKDATTR